MAIVAAATDPISRDGRSLAELYALAREAGVVDTLVRGSCCLLLRATENQIGFVYTGCVEHSLRTLTYQGSRCKGLDRNNGKAVFCERSRDGSPGRSGENH